MMRWAIAAVVALGISGCGGGPRNVQQPTVKYTYQMGSGPAMTFNGPPTPEEMRRFHLASVPKNAYVITRDEFPEVYAAVEVKDWSRVFTLLGNPQGVSPYVVGAGESLIFYIKPQSDGPVGDQLLSDVLLYAAMKAGDVEKARTVISQRNLTLNRASNLTAYGKAPLLLVFDGRHAVPRQLEMTAMLLKAGADPNVGNDRGESTLALVLGSPQEIPNRREIVAALLKAGADPNVGAARGEPLLTTVLTSPRGGGERREIAEMLLKAGANPNRGAANLSPLRAVIRADIDDKQGMAALLIKHGADPDLPDASGNLLLHEVVAFAAGTGQAVFEDTSIGLLNVILTPKTNLNARTKEGKTALGIAYLGRRAKLAAYLHSKGGTDFGFKNPSYDLSNANGVTIHGLYSGDIFALDQQQCTFILREYGVKFEALAPTPGVEIPIELQSPVSGIAYRHVTGDKKFSIMDCRLAILLVGWAPILRQHNVREIIHMRAYSPGARVGGHGRVSGHNHALALDVATVIFEDQRELTIKGDWKDHRKLDPCADPRPQQSEKERQLRRLTCETGNFDLFSVILSPHYNRDHFDHLHLELDPNQQQFMR